MIVVRIIIMRRLRSRCTSLRSTRSVIRGRGMMLMVRRVAHRRHWIGKGVALRVAWMSTHRWRVSVGHHGIRRRRWRCSAH